VWEHENVFNDQRQTNHFGGEITIICRENACPHKCGPEIHTWTCQKQTFWPTLHRFGPQNEQPGGTLTGSILIVTAFFFRSANAFQIN